MTDFDPKTPDTYLRHLSEVNQDRAVTASRAICNEQGALVVGIGTRIDAGTAKKILRHRLRESLDACVAVEDALDRKSLLEDFQSMAESTPELGKIHKALNLRRALRDLCKEFDRLPILRQKVTVLSLRLPDDFRISLFSAWLGVAISRRMGRPKNEILAVFLGGLCQDIGLLHLDESVARKTVHTARELRLWRGHPLIGRKLLEAVDKLPPGVARAVAEHHERDDGTGFPRHLLAPETSVPGQILALVNSAGRMQFHPDPDQRRPLSAFVPACMLLSNASLTDVTKVTVAMLRDLIGSHQPFERETEHADAMARRLLDINESLYAWYGMLDEIPKAMESVAAARSALVARVIVARIHFASAACGLFSEPAMRWLAEVANGNAGARESDLNEYGALQDALHYQLQQLLENLRLASCPETEAAATPPCEALKALVQQMLKLENRLAPLGTGMDEGDDDLLIEI